MDSWKTPGIEGTGFLTSSPKITKRVYTRQSGRSRVSRTIPRNVSLWRMRQSETLRGMVRETRLHPDCLVYPLFVIFGEDVRNPVPSMPGVFQLSITHLVEEAREVASLGVKSVILFGIPSEKDAAASGAYDEEGVVQMAVRALKDQVPELTVIADVCLCEYMDHGHCGVVGEDGKVDNDLSLELLAKTSVSLAEAGVDVVAPSDMMD